MRRKPSQLALRPSPFGPVRTGFSLMEMLVVIAIIMLLMGIGVAVLSRAHDSSLLQQTKGILAQCRAIASEYQTVTGNIINPNDSQWTTMPYNVPGSTGSNPTPASPAADYAVVRFAAAVWQVPSCNQMMSTLIAQKVMVPSADNAYFYTINDAWGHPIRYYASNSQSGTAPPNSSVLPNYNSPFFVSAGPDGLFGDNLLGETGATTANTQDNLYSFNIQ